VWSVIIFDFQVDCCVDRDYVSFAHFLGPPVTPKYTSQFKA
jgi:hypothetical protein